MTDDNMPDVQPYTRKHNRTVNEECYWNAAIEAAALIVQPNPHIDEERRCEDIAAEIRKLKT